ncbi:MAG TPA: hypothetical protein VHV10_17870 [Ktedonobacteraceae bacterium]|nr:hypothetical protein [Ktedonobacteraceae bacterium]
MNAQTFASHRFSNYAAKNIRVDSDNAGLFCRIPDQSGKWMTVRCVESKTSVHASHCSCSKFATHQHCNHVELVQAYWDKIYTPKVETPVVVETPKVVKARKPRNGLVRKVRNGGLIRVEQKIVEAQSGPAKTVKASSLFEQAVQATVPATDLAKVGNLGGTKAFSILR